MAEGGEGKKELGEIEGIDFSDLQKHAILGTGELANVYLVSHKKTRKTYALKIFDKLHLYEYVATGMNSVEVVNREAEILRSVPQCPFVLQMHQAWQDALNIYFLMPLIQGGELAKRLDEYTAEQGCRDRGIQVDDARFYSACVAEALCHMHKHNIAYRDLKPTNIMIDRDGYTVLIDLGFAKVVEDFTFTMCGSPGYCAPEALKSGNHGAWGKCGHTKLVDWWSFAVLLYELLAYATPFQCPGMDDYDTQDAIMIADYKCPDFFPEVAKDLIDKLLVVDVTKRLGYTAEPRTSNHTEIINHPWFTCVDFDFEKLRQRQLPAPWIPTVNNDMDTSHFYEYDEAKEAYSPYRRLTEEEQKDFADFEWIE